MTDDQKQGAELEQHRKEREEQPTEPADLGLVRQPHDIPAD